MNTPKINIIYFLLIIIAVGLQLGLTLVYTITIFSDRPCLSMTLPLLFCSIVSLIALMILLYKTSYEV